MSKKKLMLLAPTKKFMHGAIRDNTSSQARTTQQNEEFIRYIFLDQVENDGHA